MPKQVLANPMKLVAYGQVQHARAVAREADSLILAIPKLARISLGKGAEGSHTSADAQHLPAPAASLCLTFLDLLAETKFSVAVSIAAGEKP